MAMNPAEIKVTRLESVTKRFKSTYPTLKHVYDEIVSNPASLAYSWAMKMNNDGQRPLYEKFRKSIPAYIFSCEHHFFGTSPHNGLICLDFDRCDMSLKDDIAKAPFVAMVFTSPSGKGLKVVVAIQGTYDHTSKGQWAEVFSQVAKVFKDTFGITADRKASVFAHPCFSSHDPDARIATDCRPMGVGVHLEHTGPHWTTLCDKNEGVYKMTLPVAVEATYARKPGERNEKLGFFARAVKFNCDIPAENRREVEDAFRLWYNRSLPNILTKDYDENKGDFWEWFAKATKPLDPPKSSIEDAWQKVASGNYPEEVQLYSSANCQKAIALCYHLKDEEDKFYMSCKTLGGLLGVDSRIAYRIMNMFVCEGLIVLSSKGEFNKKASSYVWFGKSTTKPT
jgi:hypothetical protein